MAQLVNDQTLRRDVGDADIPDINFSFTKNEEEMVQSIAKTLAVEVPFINVHGDRIQISDDFQTETNKAQGGGSHLALVITKKDNYEEIHDTDLERSVTDDNISEIGGGNKKKIVTPVERKSVDYICKYCGAVLPSCSALKTHETTHCEKKKPHTCPSCTRTFHGVPQLTEHRCSRHATTGTYKCELCMKTFMSKSALKSHMISHFEPTQECPICCAVFSNRAQLKTHQKKHADKFYKCSECGDKFATPPSLKRHRQIHSDERRFQCEECGVAFREDATLKTHMGTHLPRGPYPCNACGEVFPRLNSLSLHKKVHNTNGAYRYVPWRKKGIEIVGDKQQAKEVPPQNHSPSDSDHTDGCMQLSDSDPSKPAGLSVLPPDPSITSDSIHLPFMDSSFSNVSQSPSDIDGAVMIEDEAVMDDEAEVLITNVPHPDVVRDALSTGVVLESQADDGQGYFIVLPKALAEKDYTLLTFPRIPSPKIPLMSESVLLQDGEELGHSDLLVWDDDLNAVTEVTFQPDPELLSSVSEVDGCKKPNREKLSDVEEMVSEEETDAKRILAMPRKDQKKERKVKEKKIRVPKSYECQLCGKDCKRASSYMIHMRTHTGERPYICDYCGMGFKQVAHLRTHVRIHTGEKPFKCNICDAAFKQSSRLKAHVKCQHIVHKVKKKKIEKTHRRSIRNFYCKICDKTFLGTCSKIQHMKTHADETLHECEECGAIYKNRLCLRRHWKAHTTDHSCICDLCDLKFRNVATLNFHRERSHGIENELEEAVSSENKDDIVGRGGHCATRSVFRLEENIEQSSSQVRAGCVEVGAKTQNDKLSVAKPHTYNCTICKKSFNKQTNLTVHLRMHTGERPYKCNNCPRAFRQISHLKDHFKVHTGEKPFKCSACSAAFCQSSAVKYHIKKKHKGKARVMKEKIDVLTPETESIVLENVAKAAREGVIIQIGNGLSGSDSCNILDETRVLGKDENHFRKIQIENVENRFGDVRVESVISLIEYSMFDNKKNWSEKCQIKHENKKNKAVKFKIKLENKKTNAEKCRIKFENKKSTEKCKFKFDNKKNSAETCQMKLDNKKNSDRMCQICSKHVNKSNIGIAPQETSDKPENICKHCTTQLKLYKPNSPLTEHKQKVKQGEDITIKVKNIKSEKDSSTRYILLDNKSNKVKKTKSSVNNRTKNCGKHVQSEAVSRRLETNIGLQRQYEASGNVCDACGKTFRRGSALKFHQRMSHSNTEEIDEDSF